MGKVEILEFSSSGCLGSFVCLFVCLVVVVFTLGHRVFLKVETLTYRHKLPGSSQMESRADGGSRSGRGKRTLTPSL